jgi:hypothetical protein
MPKITRYGGVSYAAPLADESAEAPAAAVEPAAEPETAPKARKDATVTPETARGRHERTD